MEITTKYINGTKLYLKAFAQQRKQNKMKRQPTEWGKEINSQNIQTAHIASSI